MPALDVHYPDALCIRLVLDNLNTHTGASLYEAFAPQEARRLLDRLEFHHTLNHAKWLNMAEIEIGIMNRQCLDRRIDNAGVMADEVAAWEKFRNRGEIKIHSCVGSTRAGRSGEQRAMRRVPMASLCGPGERALRGPAQAGDVDQVPRAGLATLRLLEQRVGGQITLDRENWPE